MSDTIDIEDFANRVKKDFVSFFTNLVWVSLSASMPFLNTPIIRDLMKSLLHKIIELLAGQGGLVAFVINTRVFTTDQAKDYMDAVGNILKLPEGVSDEEWEKAELKANHAFAQLVSYLK